MSQNKLSPEAVSRITHLQQAKWDLEKAINHIKLAFGDCLATELYMEKLNPLLSDIEYDLDDTWDRK